MGLLSSKFGGAFAQANRWRFCTGMGCGVLATSIVVFTDKTPPMAQGGLLGFGLAALLLGELKLFRLQDELFRQVETAALALGGTAALAVMLAVFITIRFAGYPEDAGLYSVGTALFVWMIIRNSYSAYKMQEFDHDSE